MSRSRTPVIPSPNVWYWPRRYERENRAQDSRGEIWRLLRERCDWTGRDVVDVGCGSGFHLPTFAATARHVVGVEPHGPLAEAAERRMWTWENVRVVAAPAQRLPLPDRSADLVHARTAYFFGRGCEAGLAEARRILRPGGKLVIVDLDAQAPPYGDWLRADLPRYDPADVLAFFAEQGFELHRVSTLWRFPDRAGLAETLEIEFSPKVAARALAETVGLTVEVGYRVHTATIPTGLVRPPGG